MNKNNLFIAGIAVVILVAASFFVGMKYGQGKPGANARPTSMNFQGRQPGNPSNAGARARAMNGGGFINGEVIKKDDTSVTVKLPDGGSKIIFINASSSIMKSTAGSAADLEPGKTVSVNGTPNSDGSVTAQMIQLRDRPLGAPGDRNQPGSASSTGQAK
ncbi:hypothetical protein HGA34_05715 [Candidatus Falkowbacteria bacterium]|nr:hypothetical protein [Candidatus Falkowbacteria bacterium]